MNSILYPARAETSPPSKADLTVLELGMGWFPEQAGGLNRVYYDLVHSLPAAGVNCRGLITGSSRSQDETGGAVRAVVRTDASIFERWRAIRAAVRQTFETEDIDLVAGHFAIYCFPALSTIKSKSFVYHFHGPWAAEGEREGARKIATVAKAWIERKVYRRADRLIVLSQAFKTVLCDSYGVDPLCVDIVPGSVDCDRYEISMSRREAREKLGWPSDRPIVFAIRRLVSRMGLEDLIASVSELRQRHPDVLVCIAGKGPLSQELQQQIESADLHKHVRLLGYVSDADLPVAYRAADLSIVPTVALEGFGLIAIESLAAGTPVIVTPVGGLPEVVQGLSPELICQSSGPSSLAAALDGALSNPASLPTSDACRGYARANFDLPVIAMKTKAVYQAALK